MATAKDFSKIGEIEGVANFLLVRDDGQVVSGNFDDTVSISSTIINTGKICDSFSEDLSNRRYIYFCVERTNGENIFVFSLGRYFLGVIKHQQADPALLSDSIVRFLKALL